MKKKITFCTAAILTLTFMACTGNTEQSHNDPITPVSVQDCNVDKTKTEPEQNYSVGELIIEGCYDNPNDPVVEQNYSVGEPNNE